MLIYSIHNQIKAFSEKEKKLCAKQTMRSLIELNEGNARFIPKHAFDKNKILTKTNSV